MARNQSNPKIDNIDIQLAVHCAKIELARREFFFYCQLKAPGFYADDREYLKTLCTEMQEFRDNDDDVLIINMPPRHGKSFTATNFVEWILGKDISEQVMTGSYNEDFSAEFSKEVRNTIQQPKDDDTIVYSDIFPNTRIAQGDAQAKKWSLVGGFKTYLATSPNGSATGRGASYIIIDDLIKNSYEAHNEVALEKQWKWFTDTMLSRLEQGGKLIIIMTRWNEKDLAGRALKQLKEVGYKIKHICMKALQDDGTMLCDKVLDNRQYDLKTKTMSKDIAEANYNQNCINLEGRLYTSFREYDADADYEWRGIKAYIDTADKGSDYLASLIYGTYSKKPYILDVLYTQKPMSFTEKEVAKRLLEYKVSECLIEGNNGGEGFSRAVEREYKALGGNRCRFKTFHQSKNKEARILSNSTWVMDNIFFPKGWGNMWPEYYEAMYSYQREGKNEHDDAPDATTGVAEQFVQVNKVIGTKKFKGL